VNEHLLVEIALIRKHLLQTPQDRRYRIRMQAAQPFYESRRIDRAQLVERHKTRFILKSTRNAPGVRLTAPRHWCDDSRTKTLIQLVR
jgi:hypothetical protein